MTSSEGKSPEAYASFRSTAETLAGAFGDSVPQILEFVADYFEQQEKRLEFLEREVRVLSELPKIGAEHENLTNEQAQRISQLEEHNRLLTERLEALEKAAMPVPYREQLRQVSDQVVTLTDTVVAMARAVEEKQRPRWWFW